MKGRKRHILVDTDGLLLQVCVHAANIQERAGAKLLLQTLRFPAHRLQVIWADAGYWGAKFAAWVKENCGVVLDAISHNELVNRRDRDEQGQPLRQGYVNLPRRWVVESGGENFCLAGPLPQTLQGLRAKHRLQRNVDTTGHDWPDGEEVNMTFYTPSQDEELARLRRENEVLRQERDILKKVVSIFSQPAR